MSDYKDIIDLPHHVSRKRKHMPLQDRASQFAPFAALVGYDDAVQETARLTGERIEPDEGEKQILNEKLQIIEANLGKEFPVTITHFVPDERKSGGAYVTVQGRVKKLDDHSGSILLTDGRVIPIRETIGLHIEKL